MHTPWPPLTFLIITLLLHAIGALAQKWTKHYFKVVYVWLFPKLEGQV